MTAALTFCLLTLDDRRFFAKVIREPHMAARARQGLALAAQLHGSGLDFILPALPARQAFFAETEGGLLALYPYIDTPPSHEYNLRLLGNAVARMHEKTAIIAPPQNHITFLEKSLASECKTDVGGQVRQLLLDHAAKLRPYLDLHRALGENLPPSRVPTHGDIAGNILMPRPPGFLLIDWDEACIASPERDIWFLWTQPMFVAGYRDIRPDFTPDANALRHAALSFYLDGIGLQLAAAYQPWGDAARAAQALSERRLNATRFARLDTYLAAPPV